MHMSVAWCYANFLWKSLHVQMVLAEMFAKYCSSCIWKGEELLPPNAA